MSTLFFINSILLGAGLAMDAFSVSVANSLCNPGMRLPTRLKVSGVYAGFQFLMPLLGWLTIHTIARHFRSVTEAIPWIALILLLYLGGTMIRNGLKSEANAKDACFRLTTRALLLQGIATSIDALSVGFAIADYEVSAALVCASIIAVVTMLLCLIGLRIGRSVGSRISGKATICGGLILIAIGIEIFLKGTLF